MTTHARVMLQKTTMKNRFPALFDKTDRPSRSFSHVEANNYKFFVLSFIMAMLKAYKQNFIYFSLDLSKHNISIFMEIRRVGKNDCMHKSH